MRTLVLGGTILALTSGLSLVPARSDDAKGASVAAVNSAIDRGVAWLRTSQATNGSWDYEPLLKEKKLIIGDPTSGMQQGCTALAALAMLESGVPPDDPAIEKAFVFIRSCEVKHVYSAGVVLLAIEARERWQPRGAEERTRAKPAPKKPRNPADLELAKMCAAFLVKFQEASGGWRYPLPSIVPVQREDGSHPQYALLGLDAAERLGIQVPKETYERAIGYFLDNQEQDGPDVPAFPVPGADLTVAELKKIEKEMLEKLKRVESDFKNKKKGDVNSAGHTEEDERRTVERDASQQVFKTRGKPPKIKARGWGYDARVTGTQEKQAGPFAGFLPKETTTTGSMTASGVTSLLICKARLEGTGGWSGRKDAVDRAIRDGAGWLAANYTVESNPKGGKHHYYYLYGLERVGVLALVKELGANNDWYADGARVIVDQQKKDGRWDREKKGTAGPVPDTCFALLFLSRSTTPLVRIPTRTATGPGR